MELQRINCLETAHNSQYIICHRVYDNWPLYDILNQFLKGHSQMAAVVKGKDIKYDKDNSADKPSLVNINTTLNPNLTPMVGQGITAKMYINIAKN